MARTILFVRASLAVFLAVALIGCESDSGRVVSGDDRLRLTVKDGYGDFNSHGLRINGMTADSLTPEVAQNYGIVRSESLGLINLVILEKTAGSDMGLPVRGDVVVSAANLTGQLKNVEIREITDGESIYYIGEVSVDHEETINFDFDVTPEGVERPLQIRYTYKFYTR